MMRSIRSKSFLDAFFRRQYKGTPLQDAGSPSPSPSPLKDDGSWYRHYEKVKDAMESMDNELNIGQVVDTNRVNSILRDILSTANHAFVKRIQHYLDNKQIQPDGDTLRLMMKIYEGRDDFVEANAILKKAQEYKLRPTPEMYNIWIGAFFQMGDYKRASGVYSQMTGSRIKPTSETFSLLIRYCSNSESEIETYLNMMQQQGVQPTVDTLGDAIDAFMAIGSVEKAKKVLETFKLQESCLNEAKGTLVSSLAKFGCVEDAIELYMDIKSANHSVPPTSTLALIKNIKEPKHEPIFDELLADLTDYNDWDEACADVIVWYILNEQIAPVCKYVEMRAMRWPKSNLCEMVHFLDKAFHHLELTTTEFGKLVIYSTTLIPSCTPSRRGLDSFMSVCYRRARWLTLRWVAQHYDTCGLPHNVMNYLSTFKAMLACGEPQIANAISRKMDAAHHDSFLKPLFHKHVSMVKIGYLDNIELVKSGPFALHHDDF